MKGLFVLMVTFSILTSSFAQMKAELLQQQKTQRKYLLQQILAFQTYLGYLKKGYDITQKGISTVQNIKNGEWDLHKEFFGSLKIVNPSLLKYQKLTGIPITLAKTIKESKSLMGHIKLGKQFTPGEMQHIASTCEQLIAECLNTADELKTVITSGALEMTDDERLLRIDKIYDDARDHKVFLHAYSNAVAVLSQQRLKEQHEIKTASQLNGLK